jgi:hypothetical protein
MHALIKNYTFKLLIRFVFVFFVFIFNINSVIADDPPPPRSTAVQDCTSASDKYDKTCNEAYVKEIYNSTKTCKDTSIYCYCVDFSESEYASYDCDLYLNSSNDEFISFTQYNGTLNNLTKAGYDESLTQTDNARDYITNIVNFALTFLGFIAVIGIIYSGYLYLFSGVAETADKGKKGIQYTVLGLLIIMSSYALVNTVLQAPSGVAEHGSGDTTNLEQVEGESAFNNATQKQVMEDLTAIQTNVTNLYTLYILYINGVIDDIENALKIDGSESIAINGLNEIMQKVDKLTATYQAADELKQILENSQTSFQFVPIAVAATSYDKYIKSLRDATISDLNNSLAEYKVDYDAMEDLFVDVTAKNINKLYTDTQAAFESLLDNNPTENDYLTLNKDFDSLIKTVQDLEFVQVLMNATTLKCKAPCTVQFNSLGTIDPSGQTVANPQHNWDLDGDKLYEKNKRSGDNEEAALNRSQDEQLPVECSDPEKSDVVCTYYESETYVVRLKVDSSDPNKYVGGIAEATLIVEPPDGQVRLMVYPSSETDESGTAPSFTSNPLPIEWIVSDPMQDPKIMLTAINSLPSEAIDLVFDASASLGRSGEPIGNYTFDFGDNTKQEINSDGKIVHSFPFGEDGKVEEAS